MRKATLVASVRRNDPVVWIEPITSKEIHGDRMNRSTFIFTQLTRRHLTIQQQEDILFQKVHRTVLKRYNEKISQKKEEINTLLTAINAPLNTYKESQISDILYQVRIMNMENGNKLLQIIKTL